MTTHLLWLRSSSASGPPPVAAVSRGEDVGAARVRRVVGAARQVLPSTRVRVMAAIVAVAPFSGSVSALHSRAGEAWTTAMPVGLTMGAVFWSVAIGTAMALRHQAPGTDRRVSPGS